MSLILKSLFWRPNWALFVAFMCIVSTSHAKDLDSLKQLIAGMEPGVAQAEAHLELAEEYSSRALYSEQLEECEKALKLSKKFGSDLERARVMLRVGLAHSNLDEHDKWKRCTIKQRRPVIHSSICPFSSSKEKL